MRKYIIFSYLSQVESLTRRFQTEADQLVRNVADSTEEKLTRARVGIVLWFMRRVGEGICLKQKHFRILSCSFQFVLLLDPNITNISQL